MLIDGTSYHTELRNYVIDPFRLCEWVQALDIIYRLLFLLTLEPVQFPKAILFSEDRVIKLHYVKPSSRKCT